MDKPIFDSWNLEYKNPFGAITRESECRFRIRIPKDIHLDYPPGLILFRNGFKERFLNMIKICEEKDCNVYQASFYARYSGAHYYYFSYTSHGIRHYIKKIDGHFGNIDNGDLFQLTVYAPFYETPDFLKGGIMYQIFPDRFCKSGKEHENIPYGRVLRDDWGGTPYYKPDEHGHVWNNDYFGGDLEGIRSKLDYLSDLGVTCIYLNPIFESHENHRYNTANYMKIDPLLGTEEDFKNLCEDAKSRGISVILDGVFSHTGADSIYFNKFNRYDSVGAYNSKDSKYYEWYTFYNYPNEYEAWWGIDTLPNVHEMNPDYLEYICGEDGVLNHWLNLGASGWRLDVADELPEEFIIKLRESVKSNDKEKIVIGEVWEDASNKESYGVKRLYLNGKQLDSVMNYPFREAIIGYIKGGDPHWFTNSITTILENYPKCTVDVLMNFVSTHDIERAINRFAGENCDGKSKDWMAERYLNESEYEQGKNMLKSAMVLQFFLPGVPSIYYGDEAGLQGYKDPFNRRCYPWGNEDKELIEYTKEIGKIRRSIPAFTDGKMRFIYTDNDVMIFERYNDSSRAVIFMNRYGNERTVEGLESMIKNYSQLKVLKGDISENRVNLEPYGYAVMNYTELQPEEETESKSEE